MTQIRDVKPHSNGYRIVIQERYSAAFEIAQPKEREYENVANYTIGDNMIGLQFHDGSELYINMREIRVEFIDVQPLYGKQEDTPCDTEKS